MTEIAVVIPCFNLGAFIAEAVDSVAAQTRPAAEIVVVDDGSTDRATQQRLASLARPRLQVVHIDHRGAAAARNHGAGLTTASYLLFLDADDLLDETYFEKAGKYLDENPGLDIVSSAMKAFGGADYIWNPPPCDTRSALTRGTIPITALFRRKVWDSVGGFDERLPAAMDLDFWITAFELGFSALVIEEPLLHWRVRRDSLHHSSVARGDQVAIMRMIFAKHRASIDRIGPDLLIAKETFIAAQRSHRDHLEGRRSLLERELTSLASQIAGFQARSD